MQRAPPVSLCECGSFHRTEMGFTLPTLKRTLPLLQDASNRSPFNRAELRRSARAETWTKTPPSRFALRDRTALFDGAWSRVRSGFCGRTARDPRAAFHAGL